MRARSLIGLFSTSQLLQTARCAVPQPRRVFSRHVGPRLSDAPRVLTIEGSTASEARTSARSSIPLFGFPFLSWRFRAWRDVEHGGLITVKSRSTANRGGVDANPAFVFTWLGSASSLAIGPSDAARPVCNCAPSAARLLNQAVRHSDRCADHPRRRDIPLAPDQQPQPCGWSSGLALVTL